MKAEDLHQALMLLRKESENWQSPVVFQVSRTQDPFRVLISCILSLRTRDEVTALASDRLFKLADSPLAMLRLHKLTIEKTIYPAAFYRVKTKTILDVCGELMDKYGGRVPNEIDELLKLKGVGRKTANLTITMGYGKAGICVDSHVHRIANRWGYVKTRFPVETEMALRKKLPKKYWIEINCLLVGFGQNVCRPVSPHCSKCCVGKTCPRMGVRRSR